SCRPGGKPSRFIVHPVAGEVLLTGNTHNRSIVNNARAVVGNAVYLQGQPHGDGNVSAVRTDLLELFPRFCRYPIAEKQVFTAVPCDTEFGKAQDVYAIGAGLGNGRDDILCVMSPVEWGLIYCTAGNS